MRHKRSTIFAGLLFTLLVAGLAARYPLAAQDDPVQATLDAAVENLFTATAQAEAYIGGTLAQTVEAAFRAAQTATAAGGASSSTPLDSGTPTATSEAALTMTQAADLLTATEAAAATGTALVEEVPVWVNEVATDLVRVDGGTFEMGTTPEEVAAAVNECVNVQAGNCQLAFGEDSIPPHPVTVSAFQIERTEVTYRQYLIFLTVLGPGSHLTGCGGQPCLATRTEDENSNVTFDGFSYLIAGVIEEHPVAKVTWYGADAYCRAIGRRLPTEAEWERAARGTENFIYPWGNQWDPNLAKTSNSPDETIGALPVGSLPAGASLFGAFDMAGNVAEWVNDWYDPVYYRNPEASGLDPTGPRNGVEKVVRGGSWDARPFFARSVHRQSANLAGAYTWIGFRCAADIDPSVLTPAPQAVVPAVTPSPVTDSATPTG